MQDNSCFSEQSVKKAIKSIKKSPSSGCDGITVNHLFHALLYSKARTWTQQEIPLPLRPTSMEKQRKTQIFFIESQIIFYCKLKNKTKDMKRRVYNQAIFTLKLNQERFYIRLSTVRSWPEGPAKASQNTLKGQPKIITASVMHLLSYNDSPRIIERFSNAIPKTLTAWLEPRAAGGMGKYAINSTIKNNVVIFQKRHNFLEGHELMSSIKQFGAVNSSYLASSGSLPSVQANPRPLPTRVIGSPSPKKRQSPRKINTTNVLNERKANTAMEENGFGTPKRSSPRKSMMALVVDKENENQLKISHNPLRSATRKIPKRGITIAHQGVTIYDPNGEKHGPGDCESVQTPLRKSPRKSMVGSGSSSSPANPEGKKLFAVFDPKRRLAVGSEKSSPISKKNFWGSKHVSKSDDSQMMIDAGQKKFGATQCTTCGVLYEIGNPADEASHQAYHDGFVSSVRFTGWKTERVVRELDHIGGRVIMVSPTDGVHAWRKVEEIRDIVDRDLGFSDTCIRNKESTNVFLYILDKRIIGCLVAEKIDKAFRVVPQEQKEDSGAGRLICCSNKAEKVYVGISRIWVHPVQRGRGVATVLTDAMRANMFPYLVLAIDQFAFSDPTENGMGFAESYTRKKTFLVYRR
ncbi:unnamed protein product, partial [Meganyctiphanes norvegica]